MTPKWFPNDPKHDPKLIWKWSQKGPLRDFKMTPKVTPIWFQNDPKNDPQIISKWSQTWPPNDFKWSQKWSQNDFKMIPKMTQKWSLWKDHARETIQNRFAILNESRGRPMSKGQDPCGKVTNEKQFQIASRILIVSRGRPRSCTRNNISRKLPYP